MSTLPSLVDVFVQKINEQPRSPEVVEEVPAFLRRYALDAGVTEPSSRFTDWQIVKRDNSSRINNLQNRTRRTFPPLLSAGFLQFGNPQFYDYDPVCFDCNGPGSETRIVQLDHEAILIDGEMRLVKEIAPSFVDFIQAALR